MTTFQNKVAVMKKLEQDCYSICLYLLNNERDAIDAATRTLTDLFYDESFFAADMREQRTRLKRASVMRCMGLSDRRVG